MDRGWVGWSPDQAQGAPLGAHARAVAPAARDLPDPSVGCFFLGPGDPTRPLVSQPAPPTSHDVTRLLLELQGGDASASDQLIRLVYGELHDLASHYMRSERAGHTLQPTALVHEAYMRLVDQRSATWQSRSHFYGVAAQAMRRILVDHARRKHAQKREGGQRVTLERDLEVEAPGGRSLDLIALDDALQKLGAVDARYAKVVELRFFGGLEVEQVAEALGISPATVKRDWTFAKAFLQREMDAGA